MYKILLLTFLSFSVYSQDSCEGVDCSSDVMNSLQKKCCIIQDKSECTIGFEGVGDGSISICLLGVNKAPPEGSTLYKKCGCDQISDGENTKMSKGSESALKSGSHCQIPRGEGKTPGVTPLIPTATGTLTPLIDKDDN